MNITATINAKMEGLGYVKGLKMQSKIPSDGWELSLSENDVHGEK